MANNKIRFKILKGTVVKYEGIPVQLRKSIIVEGTDRNFNIEDHDVVTDLMDKFEKMKDDENEK